MTNDENYARETALRPCCNHMDYRHIVLSEGNAHGPAETICLTAFCRCGRKSLRVRGQFRRKINKRGESEMMAPEIEEL